MRSDWAIDVKMRQEIADDVATISRLETVKVALKVLRRVTGLRIAVVARVTDHSWTACAVLDEAGFGLLPGDQLDVEHHLLQRGPGHRRAIAHQPRQR